MRFLVIRLSSIGDIVHAIPAVSALAKTFPEAKVDWVVEKRLAVLLGGNPYIRRVIKLDTLGWRRSAAPLATIEKMARSVVALREFAYETAIDFQGLYKSAIIARISRSRERLGFAENWLREPAAGVFYTERVAPRGRHHIIEMNFSLVERLGVRVPEADQWEFPLPRTPEDDRYVEKSLASLGAQDFVVVNPGGGWQAKRWAPERYAELIQRLESELDGTILLTGSPDEEPMIQEILRAVASKRAHFFPSTLVQFIALARRARLFIGGDTGPTHLAAAVGAPIVAIFSGSDPWNTLERNRPFLSDDIALSNGKPVSRANWNKNAIYIGSVSVETVLQAIRTRLARAHA
jgi:heptosyltransferase-1